MKQLCTFLFSLLFALPMYSQTTVQGKILDDKQQPIEFASVALVAAKDSQLIKGALTDAKGMYQLLSIKTGNYRIIASTVGFERVVTPVFDLKNDSKTATVDVTMLPATALLKDAVIVAQRPLFEQKADRLVVNVANSPVAAGGTALEILQKVPGIAIIQDKITLGGNQNIQIWLDGKPSQYTDMNAVLRDMPGDQIDRIELITQPGARYDAAGGPILNIILKRNAELGFTGTASMTLGGYNVNQNDINAGYRKYYRANPSVNLNYRSGILSLFGNVAYNQGDYFTVQRVNRFIANQSFKSQNFEETDYNFRNLRVGADIYATKQTTFGIILRGWARNAVSNASNETNVFKQDLVTKLNSFITDNLGNSQRSGYSSNFNIKHELDAKTGHSLNFDLDYNRFDTKNDNNLTIYKKEPNSFRSLSQQTVVQPVDIWVVKADYTRPIDSTLKAEIGVKSSFATIDNSLKFYRAKELSNKESNDFLYKENVNAGYFNLSKKLGKLDLNAGIRAEQTIVNGTSMAKNVLDRNYLQWFPSASALYHINQNIGIQAAYSRRINRPGFQQQNPFSSFIDSLTYTRGNPNLLPEIISLGQLLVVYDGQPFLSIKRSLTTDVIIENAPQLEGTKTFTTAANLANYNNWTIEANFPIKIGKWLDGFGGNQAIYNAYNANYLNSIYTASRWHWLAYWGVTAKLPADIKLEINGFYMTKFLEEFLTIGSIGSLNMGVSKQFWEKRGKLSFNFNDILYTQKTDAVIGFQAVQVDFFQRQYSRNMRLTFSYQFGNTKVKNARSRGAASESETSRIKVE
jgi:outer membrane receptor protein involved in Fe transport